MGVERALVGSSPFQSSLPFEISNARMAGSSVPAMKIRPPAVTIGPPRAMEPYSGGPAGAPPMGGNWPSGTVHLISAVSASTAFSIPHGGGLQSEPPGLRKVRRFMPYGVPIMG